MLENVLAVLLLLLIFAVIARAVIAGSPGGFEAWRVRRRHRRTVSIAITDLQDNQLGHITGRVSATAPLVTAPLTSRPCVYYALVVSLSHDRKWHLLIDERCGAGFAITDRPGRAIIDPSNAQLALCFDRIERTGWLDHTSLEQDAILARHGITSRGRLVTKSLRFREAIIEVGDLISVVGAGIREPRGDDAGETDYR